MTLVPIRFVSILCTVPSCGLIAYICGNVREIECSLGILTDIDVAWRRGNGGVIVLMSIVVHQVTMFAAELSLRFQQNKRSELTDGISNTTGGTVITI